MESGGEGERRADGDEERKRGRIREEVSNTSREGSCCHANKAIFFSECGKNSYNASHYEVTLQQMAGECQTKALVHRAVDGRDTASVTMEEEGAHEMM